MYFIYGAENSRATDQAENLLIITNNEYKVFYFEKHYTLQQIQRLQPGTTVVPHIYKNAEYIGGLKELYNHLYLKVIFDEDEENERKNRSDEK